MVDVTKTPDPFKIFTQCKDWIYEFVFKNLGICIGSILIILLFAIGLVWWKWGEIYKLPFVSSTISHLSRWSVPKADPNRFSILVAHLDNDTNREQELLTVEALKEFEGVQVLRLDRKISLEGPVPEEEEKNGHEKARGYLKESGASVLIWGTVISQSGNTIPKLYWTTLEGRDQLVRRYYSPTIENQLRLPEIFWSDLAEYYACWLQQAIRNSRQKRADM